MQQQDLSMNYPKSYTVSKLRLHLFFAFSTIFFILVVLIVAGLRVGYFVSAQEEQRIREETVSVNESNIRPVKPTPDMGNTSDGKDGTKEPTVTPEVTEIPTITPSPTPTPTPVEGVDLFYLQEERFGQEYMGVTVTDNKTYGRNLNLGPECSTISAKLSHDNQQIAFICEQNSDKEDALVDYVNNLYLVREIKLGPISSLSNYKFPEQEESCSDNPGLSKEYYARFGVEWSGEDSKLLVGIISENVCDNSDEKSIRVGEINLADGKFREYYQSAPEDLNYSDLTYSSDYKSAYLYAKDPAGTLILRKIFLAPLD